uniref:Plastocyanin-like domain-containing protein n=1 Tax=Oryza brachyantha TaxID=4533 RepID=J3KW08_ORYBR
MNLPSGEFDLHLVIADREFYENGSIFMNTTGTLPDIHPQWQPEYFGMTMTVNGKAWPYLNVHRRRYRLRILNACNARYLDIRFSNGLPFHVIAADSSYLFAPVTVSHLVLSPAEIFDVVVDFSLAPTATEIELLNSAPYPYGLNGTAPDPNLDGKVMKFNVAPYGQLDDTPDNSKVPEHGVPYANVSALPPTMMTRYIVLYENMTTDNKTMNLYINGLRLEDPVTETPRSGTTELWHVINLTGDNHPLHVHLGTLQAIQMRELIDPLTFKDCMIKNNNTNTCNLLQHAVGATLPVPEEEKTWKNVVKVPPNFVTSGGGGVLFRGDQLHDQEQQHEHVQPPPARRRRHVAGARGGEDVEERGEGAAELRDVGGGGVLARGDQPVLPLRRHHRARVRLPLPHPGSRGQRYDQATQADEMVTTTHSIYCAW